VITAFVAAYSYKVELTSQQWGTSAKRLTIAGLPVDWFGEQTTGTLGLTWIAASRATMAPGFRVAGAAALPRWSSLTIEDTLRDCRSVREVAVGLPFRAFAARWSDPEQMADARADAAGGPTAWVPAPLGLLVPLEPREPTNVIPLGFAANTVVWAIASFAAWHACALLISRTEWFRARRGLCRRCAYPLPQSTSAEVRCPECGKLQAPSSAANNWGGWH
jgi:hypothetical protein